MPRTPQPGAWRAYRPAVWAFALLSSIVWSIDAPALPDTHLGMLITLIIFANLADLWAVRIQQGMRVSAAHFAAPFAVIATSVLGGVIAAIACLLSTLR